MKNHIKLFEELTNTLDPSEFLKITSFEDQSEDVDSKYYGEDDYGIVGYPRVLKINTTITDISKVCDREKMVDYIDRIIDRFMGRGGNVILYKEPLRVYLELVLAGLLTKYPYSIKKFKNEKWNIISFYERDRPDRPIDGSHEDEVDEEGFN